MNRQSARKAAARTLVLACLVCAANSLLAAGPAAAQEDPVKLIEAKRAELAAKEQALKREEERIATLRKDVEAKIAEYAAILDRIEAALKQAGQAQGEKIANVVKAYEAMPPEDAAVRISALDDATALLIMRRMKSKKAGAVMAAMDPQRAAFLTRGMTSRKEE